MFPIRTWGRSALLENQQWTSTWCSMEPHENNSQRFIAPAQNCRGLKGAEVRSLKQSNFGEWHPALSEQYMIERSQDPLADGCGIVSLLSQSCGI